LKVYNKDVDITKIEDYEEIAGHGILAKVGGKEILAGNSKLMNKENIKYQEVETLGTIVHVAVDKKWIVQLDDLSDFQQMLHIQSIPHL